MDKLHDLIAIEDIPRITSLKPSRVFDNDNYVWIHTKFGQYSVKSGYEAMTELKKRGRNQEVLEPSTTGLKCRIWKLKTSRELKHYLWQTISVASCSRLVDRHCGVDRSCPRCGEEDETVNHLLFECPPALQTWALSSLHTIPGSFPSSSIYRIYDHLLLRTTEMGATANQIDLFPWIIWYIWKARNEKAFKGKDISPLETAQLAEIEAENWSAAQIVQEIEERKDKNPDEPIATAIERWPRCRTDASWKQEDTLFGCGFEIQNADGSRVTGMRASERGQSPLHAELEAITWAMKTAIGLGYTLLHLETDCSQILKFINEEEEWTAFTTELEEFLHFHSVFTCFSISFIPRTENIRAGALAKKARSQGSVFIQVDSLLPSWDFSETNSFVAI